MIKQVNFSDGGGVGSPISSGDRFRNILSLSSFLDSSQILEREDQREALFQILHLTGWKDFRVWILAGAKPWTKSQEPAEPM